MLIDLAKNIVIFDEAHNIEKQVEEANSYQLSLQTLKKCQVYFENMNKLLQKDPEMLVKVRIKENRDEEDPKDKKKKPEYIEIKLKDLEIRQLEKPVLCLLEAFNRKKEELEMNFREKISLKTDITKEGANEIFQSTRLEAKIGERIFDYFSNMKDPESSSHFKNGIDENNFSRFIEIARHPYSNKNCKLRSSGQPST